MGQVPHYLLIGRGRLARHLQQYFHLLNLSVSTWSRDETAFSLADKSKTATHILLAISDSALQTFAETHERLFQNKIIIHFSGALVLQGLAGAHPLMTFTENLYTENMYRQISFVIEKNKLSFSDMLPGLPNKNYELDPALKPLYHAACVLSGNFTVLLWQKSRQIFEKNLSLPADVLALYQQQIADHAAANQLSLTGPLARRDNKTIEKNLLALNEDAYRQVYAAFVRAFEEENDEKSN